jgi:hypothetical protein
MSVLTSLIAIGVTLVLLLAGIGLRRIIAAFLEYRGHRLVTCPENQRPAGVLVDAWHAAATAAGGDPMLRVTGCSRWPDHSGCGQECLAQVESAPQDCRLENVLRHWYEGKYCAWCGQPVHEAYWTACRPVVLSHDGALLQWDEIPTAQLPDVLSAAVPICFHCYARAQADGVRGGVRAARP